MCAPSLKRTVMCSYQLSNGKEMKIPVEVSLFERYITRRGSLAVNFGIDWAVSRSRWTAYLNADMKVAEVQQWGASKYGDPLFNAEVFKAIRSVINEVDVNSLPEKDWSKINKHADAVQKGVDAAALCFQYSARGLQSEIWWPRGVRIF